MQFEAPDNRTLLRDPTPEEIVSIVRNQPLSYWHAGGNGEATLTCENGGPTL